MRLSTIRFPAALSRNVAVRALRFVWTLPTNLVGHLVGLTLSGGRGIRRVESATATAVLYPIHLPGLARIGAVALGEAVIHAPGWFEGLRGKLLLCHELSHTRQHHVLGPLYLPAHIVCQITSAALFLLVYSHKDWPSTEAYEAVARGERLSPVHVYNPLEQRWICLGFDACHDLERGERLSAEERAGLMQAFGVQ